MVTARWFKSHHHSTSCSCQVPAAPPLTRENRGQPGQDNTRRGGLRRTHNPSVGGSIPPGPTIARRRSSSEYFRGRPMEHSLLLQARRPRNEHCIKPGVAHPRSARPGGAWSTVTSYTNSTSIEALNEEEGQAQSQDRRVASSPARGSAPPPPAGSAPETQGPD